MSPTFITSEKKGKENDLTKLADTLESEQTTLDILDAADHFFKKCGFGEVSPNKLSQSVKNLYKTIVIRGAEFKTENKPLKIGGAIIKKGTGKKGNEHDFKKTFSIKFASSFLAALALFKEIDIEKPSIIWPTQLSSFGGDDKSYNFLAGEPAWTILIYTEYFEGDEDLVPSDDWLMSGCFLLEDHAIKAGIKNHNLEPGTEGTGASIAMLMNICQKKFNQDLNPFEFVDKSLPVKTGSRRGGKETFQKIKGNIRSMSSNKLLKDIKERFSEEDDDNNEDREEEEEEQGNDESGSGESGEKKTNVIRYREAK